MYYYYPSVRIIFSREREVFHILRHKLISLFLAVFIFTFAFADTVNAEVINYYTERERASYELMWNNSEDSDRYFMPTEVKAYACGLTVNEFKFFARVVEGEGADSDDDITDKVLVACTVLNRMRCKSWPTTTVLSTLQRPGQFLVVDPETHECNMARSLDSEWAVVIAYRLTAECAIDCHMVYYNSIGFTGYSRYMTDYAFFGGNYFSCIPCDCESCTALEPDWVEEDVVMLSEPILRPEGVSANYF